MGFPYGSLSIVIWRRLGLPCSACFTQWVSVRLSAGGIIDRVERHASTPTIPLTILVRAFQHFWPVHPHGVYQQFTYVTRTILPSSHPVDAARIEFLSRFALSVLRLRATLFPKLHTSPLPVMHVGVRNCRRYGRLIP